MGATEQWMSEVEHQLRNLNDTITTQSVNRLFVQAQMNLPAPTRATDLPSSPGTQDFEPDPSEAIYIQILYDYYNDLGTDTMFAWREVSLVKGMYHLEWQETGRSGTIHYRPAREMNDNVILVTDSNGDDSYAPLKVFIARWNPAASAYLFSTFV